MNPKFTCNVCSFTCNSLQNFRLHLQDFQAHLQIGDRNANENSQNNEGNQNTFMNPTANSKFSCKDCNFNCSSLQNYRIHLQTIHQESDENTQKMNTQKAAYIPEKSPGKAAPNIQARMNIAQNKSGKKAAPNIQAGRKTALNRQPGMKAAPNIQSGPETMHGSSGRNIAKLKDYISRADREPLIGLEYVLEYRIKTKGNQAETRYFCELCECDTDIDPMVEHLAGFGHRKLYLAKEYPYVLKAQSKSKEDQSQFIRRMALEIEREDGTKMYMIDPSIWMETMMTLRTADKKMKKKTRWDNDKNDQARMKRALNFLGTFEIESEIESTTVARLCEKLTANLKLYNNKAKHDALFPARVARAQDVAMSLIKNAARQRTHMQKGKPKMPPQFNQGPSTFPKNINLKNKAGMQSGFHGTNFQNMNAKQNVPMAPPYQQAQKYPFVPSNKKQTQQLSSMSRMNENPQKADDLFLKNVSQEDSSFLKKLTTLLEALPQKASRSDTTQMDSKLLMLKSLLENQKNTEHEQANQKLMTQIASMVQDTISAQNASLNQQLMMLMTSQNSASMAMQSASLRNNLMATDPLVPGAGFVPGIQSSAAMQPNVNSLMPFNQSFGNQMYGQMEGDAFRLMNQNAYQAQQAEMQSYSSASQSYENLGYGNSAAGNYLPQGDPYVSQRDGNVNSLTTGQNEQKLIPYTDVGYESSVGGKEWDKYYGNSSTQIPGPRYDRSEEKAAYTRVSLSPSSSRNQYDFETIKGEIRTRANLRSYLSSDWDDQERDMRYSKRPRLDVENRSDQLQSLGINTAGMSEALIKRIQGKDLFTASAIISEYSEQRSGQ